MSDNYQICKKVRDSMILNLRDAFSKDKKYIYDDDLKISKIHISDVTPMEALKIPSIIISTVGIDEMRYLQDDFLQETSTGYSRSAGLNVRVSIEILTLDTIKKDEITDRVYQLLKDFKDILADNGIAIFKTDLLPERKEFIQDRWFYKSGLTISCYSEWIEGIVVGTVSSVNIQASITI